MNTPPNTSPYTAAPAPPLPTVGLAVVCVGFDDETPGLLSAALKLARRTGVDLRFVHVLEDPLPGTWVADTPLYNVSPILVHEAIAEQRRRRESSMRELMSALPPDVRATSALLAGDVVSAVVRDAESAGASLILVASHAAYPALMPSGFSVALRLMAEATMPVLVSNRQHPLNFDKERFAILLADDLQPSTEEAARRTYELAAFLGAARVRHLHVHGDFRELLRDRWLEIKARHPTLDPGGKSVEAALLAEHEGRLAALARRGGAMRQAALARGVMVEVDIRTGDVATCLEDELRDVQPDLVVFGRHRTLRLRPFLIGRVGVRTMLHGQHPVLLVPPQEQLYAPFAFPGRRAP